MCYKHKPTVTSSKRSLSLKRKLLIITVILAAIFLVDYIIWCHIPQAEVFDEIINNQLIAATCGNKVPFKILRKHDFPKLIYYVEFDLATEEPDVYANVDIVVKPPALFRIRTEGLFISPQGGYDFVIVNSPDGLYEIVVKQSNHLMEGLAAPSLNTDMIAKTICKKYSERVIPNGIRE